MIEFDVETTGLQHHGAATCDLFLVAFHDGEDTLLLAHPESREAIQKELLKDDGYRAWNSKFDLHVLKQAGYALPPDSSWHDGMVQSHIMDERTSVALKARGALLFGDQERELEEQVQKSLKAITAERRKAAKAEGIEFVEANYSDVPDDIMRPYAAQDVELQRRIGNIYDKTIADSEDFTALYDLERRVMRALFWMEDRGMPFDREALIGLEASILPALDEQEQRCKEIAEFENFNPRSPKQVSEALDRLKANTTYMTRSSSSGLLVTDEENLEACDHPLADAILAYRSEHKLFAMLRGIVHSGSNDSKFPHAYLTAEDRVHANYRQLGARTGRMSCSNPNLQQVPRDDLRLRYAVCAGEGKKLVTADLDSIELRLLAAFAGEGAMLNAMKAGRDIHTMTAEFAGLSGRERASGSVEDARQQGKRMNYLTVYGGGIRAMRKWFGVSQDGARTILQRYHRAYPEVTALQNRVEFSLEDRGYVKSPLTGRRWRLQYDVRDEGYKFLNYLIQGTAADMIKLATARCHEQGVPLVAVVHDEIIAEPDAADAEDCARIIEAAMTEGYDTITSKVPITAEAQIVQRWSQAKKPDYVPDYVKES